MTTLKVVAAIIENGPEILVSSRPAGKAYAGYWEFPGGKVEPDETLFMALRREIQEELGLEITHARPWLVRIHEYAHARVRLHFFRVKSDGWRGAPTAKEAQMLLWQTPGDWTARPMLEANAPILRALEIPVAWTLEGQIAQSLNWTLRLPELVADTPTGRENWRWLDLASLQASAPDGPLIPCVKALRSAADVAALRAHLAKGATELILLLPEKAWLEEAYALIEEGAHGVIAAV